MNPEEPQPNSEEEVDNRPKIIISQGRSAKTGNMTNNYKVIPLIPGTIINRCGRKYIVDKYGTQRRVKEEK